jgi:hypothetical protein
MASTSILPETVSRIESVVPTSPPATSLELWQGMGCRISHTQIKTALKLLVDDGRVLRSSEPHRGTVRYRYTRMSA